MNKGIKSDILLSITLAVFALVVLWVLIPGQISVPPSLRGKFLSPAFSPRVFAGFILAMAGVLLFQSLSRIRSAAETIEPENGWTRHGISLLVWISCCIFLVTVYLFGIILPSILFLGALMVLFGQRRWAIVASVMILTPLILYLFFHRLAKINFPPGILFE